MDRAEHIHVTPVPPRLRQALHAAVDAFLDALEAGDAPDQLRPQKLVKSSQRRRGAHVPSPPEPTDELAKRAASKALRRLGIS